MQLQVQLDEQELLHFRSINIQKNINNYLNLFLY